jgi:AcrR family transcriptional regulator
MRKRPDNAYWRQVAIGGTTGAAGRHARSLATRTTITVSAAELFAEHGFRGVSLGMIAERAGVPKGSLTSYFPSKLALARCIVEEMGRRWAELGARAEECDLDPLHTLLHETQLVISAFAVDPVLRGGVRLAGDPDVVPSDDAQRYLFGERRAVELLTRAAAAGVLRPDVDPAAAARLYLAVAVGHATLAARHPCRMDAIARLEESWRLIAPGVASDDWLNSQPPKSCTQWWPSAT